ncbi:YdeI/OmpD-associated family protein [Hymenobacter endophyticus]|uniref:YdeI/OmpD-associated family protein n=1 Tax=Hymenobacter endophyticus TaxID=3076335 RepID=A0ABU3TED6_9BACT|nr:YdeI/OmpD-associated family protein [Hymenobacter endophyticus]MDU0369630.1 YdeI/OmpD-associated family protein [Hymenobacter endophyticus]
MTTCQFEATMEAGGPNFMPTQIVVVPPLVLETLGGLSTRRVTGTLNGYAVRLGLLPLTGGGRYLMINKDVCQAAGVQVGQRVTLTLAPDPEPDRVDLPGELAQAFEAWPEAETEFGQLSGSMRRAVAQHVRTAKQAETRARRAVELTERLARGAHPFRKP